MQTITSSIPTNTNTNTNTTSNKRHAIRRSVLPFLFFITASFLLTTHTIYFSSRVHYEYMYLHLSLTHGTVQEQQHEQQQQIEETWLSLPSDFDSKITKSNSNSNSNSNTTTNNNTNTNVHLGLVIASGGLQSCQYAEKMELVDIVWEKLLKSFQYALWNRPNWKITVVYINDALPCLNLTSLEEQLNQTLHASTIRDRIQFWPIRNDNVQGIGKNIQRALDMLYEKEKQQQPIDYFINLDDDMISSRNFILHTYQAYVHNKHKHTHKQKLNHTPLIATAYGSRITPTTPDKCNATKTKTTTHHPSCQPFCKWTHLAYGANYFFDRETYVNVVRPAFSQHYKAWNGKRPKSLQNINTWDNWVLDEYYEVLGAEHSCRYVSITMHCMIYTVHIHTHCFLAYLHS